jgi:hypothetical protein
MDRWGRKPIFTSSLILTGVACIPVGFLEDGSVGKVILPLIGKIVNTITGVLYFGSDREFQNKDNRYFSGVVVQSFDLQKLYTPFLVKDFYYNTIFKKKNNNPTTINNYTTTTNNNNNSNNNNNNMSINMISVCFYLPEESDLT